MVFFYMNRSLARIHRLIFISMAFHMIFDMIFYIEQIAPHWPPLWSVHPLHDWGAYKLISYDPNLKC